MPIKLLWSARVHDTRAFVCGMFGVHVWCVHMCVVLCRVGVQCMQSVCAFVWGMSCVGDMCGIVCIYMWVCSVCVSLPCISVVLSTWHQSPRNWVFQIDPALEMLGSMTGLGSWFRFISNISNSQGHIEAIMMKKCQFHWWRKPEYPQETTDRELNMRTLSMIAHFYLYTNISYILYMESWPIYGPYTYRGDPRYVVYDSRIHLPMLPCCGIRRCWNHRTRSLE